VCQCIVPVLFSWVVPCKVKASGLQAALMLSSGLLPLSVTAGHEWEASVVTAQSTCTSWLCHNLS
jgi:hypothetical protein